MVDIHHERGFVHSSLSKRKQLSTLYTPQHKRLFSLMLKPNTSKQKARLSSTSKTGINNGRASTEGIGQSHRLMVPLKKYQTEMKVFKEGTLLKRNAISKSMEFLLQLQRTHSPNKLSTRTMDMGNSPLPRIEPSKISSKELGVVSGFAANTNKGIIRTTNEDRVSILLNILPPSQKKDIQWPRCHCFGVFDGHGGSTCAEFLRKKLHDYFLNQEDFPSLPFDSLTRGFQAAELDFINQLQEGVFDQSGSCALMAIFIDEACYIANVGDSRAIASVKGGTVITQISNDHKPGDPSEFARIIKGGGSVYQQQITPELQEMLKAEGGIQIPLRLSPGGLSVSRAFGDIAAKLPVMGGNPEVLIAVPDIRKIPLDSNLDFILLACDGVYDTLSNEDVIQIVWSTARQEHRKRKSIHEILGSCAQQVLRTALEKNSLDNVTVIIIAFENFQRTLDQRRKCDDLIRLINMSISRNDSYMKSSIRKEPESTKKISNHHKTMSEESLRHSTGGGSGPKPKVNTKKIVRILGLSQDPLFF